MGHSFAGKVAAAVANRAPEKVRRVIYLDAFRPERVREPQGGFDPTREFGPAPPGGFAIPLTEEIVERIGQDVRGAPRERMMRLATPSADQARNRFAHTLNELRPGQGSVCLL